MNFLFSKKTLWITGFLSIVIQGLLLLILGRVGTAAEVLKLQTTFSRQTFQSLLDQWGPEKVEAFLGHYSFDFFILSFIHVFWPALSVS